MEGIKTSDEVLTAVANICENVEQGKYLEINYETILSFYNYIENRLKVIQEVESDISFSYQVLEEFSIIEKRRDLIMTEQFLTEVNNLESKDLKTEEASRTMKMKLQESCVIALKYQYRYYLSILEQILQS